ncbi:unnamed protein product [Durusdinium trenchii]|uniref:Uncharacterized protein n=1 Tax=Durusdinium trenchii TaxID=1381693 RepID=A0ABP0LXV5_9DINO
MPSVLFDAEEVKYCEAPFPKVRLGFNKRAGALNMIYSPSDAALELVSDVFDLQVQVEGKTCAVGAKDAVRCTWCTSPPPQVMATFADEALAVKFAGHLKGTPEEVGTAAPSTPVRRPSKLGMDLTPPRCVRPKLQPMAEDLEKGEECKKA